MQTMKTNREIAGSFDLWQEYADTMSTWTEDEFDAMTEEQRMDVLEAMFGADETTGPVVRVHNGEKEDLADFAEANPDAVYYDASGFETWPDLLPEKKGDYPVLVWENEADSENDDGARTIGRIDWRG